MAAYLRNISPTKAITGMTPYEAWTGKRPLVEEFLDVRHLYIFPKMKKKETRPQV